MTLALEDYYYIPIKPGSKRPLFEWGGYPIDPKLEHIYEYDELPDHPTWAIVGNKTQDLLIIDIDMYKMSDDEQDKLIHSEVWEEVGTDVTTTVRSKNGGIHVYFRYDGDLELSSCKHVDLKGDVGKGYAIAPFSDEYELRQDYSPITIDDDGLRLLPVIDAHATTDWPLPPCVREAEKNDDDDFFEFMGYLKVRNNYTGNIYTILNRDNYPENVNTSAPNWLHETPSSTGLNFRVDDGAGTFRCWRHNMTGNVMHLVGIKEGIINCGDWKHQINWGAIVEAAKKYDIYIEDNTPLCEYIKEAGWCPVDCGRNTPFDP